MFRVTGFAFVLLGIVTFANADESITPDNLVDPGPNQLDEALAKDFSLDRAVNFLDSASLHWLKARKCFTCHTNIAYLYARPAIGTDSAAHKHVRQQAEDLVTKRWPTKGPRWDAEVVSMAAALAFNDANTTGKLHPTTRIALDRMWTTQQKDGGWEWLKCNWPPFEYDNHYGVTIAAIAVGVAPDRYSETDAAQKGVQGIRRYLRNHPPENLHHRAMLLWSSTYLPDLISDAEKRSWTKELLSKQKPDGGWASAEFGQWKRADETPQNTKTSDEYGTGFAVYVLGQSGVPSEDKRIENGIRWLKNNQRESGRWISRSLYRDNKHFLSHAGSAFAVMALTQNDRSATKVSAFTP